MLRDLAIDLMTQFAARTGITGERAQRRYLWTDAFAVCNFVGFHRETGDAMYLELARRLVDQVHHSLGRHRPDDPRTGWISGLSDQDGEAHPTLGGLRIGKPLPERAQGDGFNERLEWERDGQYFHYLTKWMHALDQLARSTGDIRLGVWARELADTAHRRFTYGDPLARMYWKMSIDLSRSLVASMGHHDPLDGFVTCAELAATSSGGPDLRDAQRDFAAMIDWRALATADPLGIGGLLFDAHCAACLHVDRALVEKLLAAAELGLRQYVDGPELHAPAADRLAFRELGLAIGLGAIAAMEPAVTARFARYLPLRDQLPAFWLRPDHRRTRPWIEHADINDVMLATSLVPDGFVTLYGLAER